MKVVRKEIAYTRPDTFRLFPIGDIHAGSIHCAEKEIKDKIAEIKGDSKAYILGMGDYADSITQNDKRFDTDGLATWVEKRNIMESQRRWLRALFEPVKGKIIALGTGNHEEAVHNISQDDLVGNLCYDLKVPYGGYVYYADLVFIRKNSGETHLFQILCWHGAGSARTDGARTNTMLRLVNDFVADIYITAHLHGIKGERPQRIVCEKGIVKVHKLVSVMSGSWLRAYTQGDVISYAEMKGLKPTAIGCPVIEITPNTGEVKVIM